MSNRDNTSLQVYKWLKVLFSVACLCYFAYYTIKWAWCSDDAYHAYVMAKNLINGQGFTPTIGKRVNVSTCPLWTLLTTLGMLVWRDEYYVGMLLNLLFSWGAFAILLLLIWGKNDVKENKIDKSNITLKMILLLSTTMLICKSKAFISYTTSGLENAFLFFLSSVFLSYFFYITKEKKYFEDKDIFWLAFLEGLIIFARMDAGLIFLPLCVYAGLFVEYNSWGKRIRGYVKRVGIAILGMIPFIVWEIFSFWYYGMLVPNTALAKLNTGFPQYEYTERGIAYFVMTLEWDFVVVAIPALFVLLSVVIWGSSRFSHKYVPYPLIGLGVLIYMVYIIHIGGDFMKGRHFTVVFWISLFSLAHIIREFLQKNKIICACLIWLFVFFSIAILPVLTGDIVNNYAQKIRWVYVDERGEYLPYTGLINVLKSGRNLVWECPHRGIQWYSGIDSYEDRLYDPLLSRLPAIDNDDTWMVGHMEREFPEGYRETLKSGENCIVNKSLHDYYDLIYEIINGDLFSIERVKKIIHLNKGDYNYLIEEYISTIR